MRTRKVAQHTSPSQPLARDVPVASERLASLCAPTADSLASSTFQMGPSTHRSASRVESDSDSEDHHHPRHHQYTPVKRDARKPLKRDEQISGEDADVDADADADADDDEVAVVPPPFAPPPCLYIQPGAAQPVTSFSLAQPGSSAQPTLAPPKMPLFPFMPLLPTPREHSSPPPDLRSSD
jgi:hypothetical protein